MQVSPVEEFESLWESGNGVPDVFAFLEEHPELPTADRLSILIRDQRRRWQTDTPLSVEEYLRRLPVLAAESESRIQLAVAEFRARLQGDTSPSIDEFTSRFDDISQSLRPKLEDVLFTTVSQDSTVRDRHIGRYRIARLLGEGAFGVVWLAFDTELHRQVAIKVPAANRFQKPEDAESYLAEARTVAKLDHPNIVPVHDVGRSDDGGVYVVSKYIEGGTLRSRMKQNRPGFDESTRLIATCAMALHEAHQKRIVHRDVKPDNILIDEESGTPYVADFGLAICEEDFAKQSGFAGTPAYMSPEQARGEGHRLDGRSDVFSLAIILYELVTGQMPFRGSTPNELFHQIISVDPKPPHELDESIPSELQRICLRALAKQASDRYATAADFAEDLSQWDHSPDRRDADLQIVPKGLRSFDASDADFYLGLLPGPRNRDGLPESIQFWRTRIEEKDPDKTFSVGLIYGPSGCGKSSLMKAGLLPRLESDVAAVYLEATPDETETRIVRGLRKQFPELRPDAEIAETFTLLRKSEGKKVVVIDQFEQWLHAHPAEPDAELVRALRQCDGGRLQAIVMVRDDFAMAAARFMDALDIPILQGHNFATVDLFDIDHSEKVLTKFGQAFGKLPAQFQSLSDQQREFIRAAAFGLAQEDKIVSVRLALFAEMIKGKAWEPATLTAVGGTEGIGVNFLEETFSARTANPTHRLYQEAARDVLKMLLPEVGSDIKGHMRSHADLLEACGYQNRTGDFHTLLRILDGEMRLITPTDPEGFQTESGTDPNSKFYQLTHDYLVPALREWLTRKQQETRRGRTELKLAERSNLWNAKPENRHLPSLAEWARIRALTDKQKWNEPQRRMMGKAGLVHGVRSALTAAALSAIVLGGVAIRNSIEKGRAELVAQKQQEQDAAEATQIVQGLLQADTSQVKTIIGNLTDYQEYAKGDLRAAFDGAPNDSNAKLHAALAMLPEDPSVLPFLQERLLTVTPAQFQHVRELLEGHKGELIAGCGKIASDDNEDPARRFQAACALASYDPENEHWQRDEFTEFVAGYLVGVLPSELLPWRNALRPVKRHLAAALGTIFRDKSQGEQVRSFATDTLADYSSDDIDGFFELLMDAEPRQFAALFDGFAKFGDEAITRLDREVNRILTPQWNDTALDPAWKKPADELVQQLEQADGMVAERFAFCQTMPLTQFLVAADELHQSGFRPIRFRPYAHADEVNVAAAWTRDGRDWRIVTGESAEAIQQQDARQRKDGFVAVDVAGYVVGKGRTKNVRYGAIWCENANNNKDARIFAGVLESELSSVFKEEGYKLPHALQNCLSPTGQELYSGVKSKSDASFEWWIGMSQSGFENREELAYVRVDIDPRSAAAPETTQNRNKKALADAESKLKDNPENLDARFARARATFYLREDEEAMSDLGNLIQHSPEFTPSYQLRAILYARVRNAAAARQDLRNFSERNSSESINAYLNVVVSAYLGDEAAAIKHLETLVEENGENDGTLYDAACAYSLAAEAYVIQDATKSRLFADRAVSLLRRAIAAGYRNYSWVQQDPDLDPIKDHDGFVELMKAVMIDRRYCAVWNESTRLESRESHGLSPEEHLQECSAMREEGYRLASISAASIHGLIVTTSVWHRPLIPDERKETLASRQANAAVALIRMGKAENAWTLLRHTPDPSLRTILIHRLVATGDRLDSLLSQLDRQRDVSVRRALILAIGDLIRRNPPAESQLVADTLLQIYRSDPDPGVHGAAEWALGILMKKRPSQLAQSGPEERNAREWFVNSNGQTMSVIETPGAVVVGTLASGIYSVHRHRTTIPRRFCISSTEVTVKQMKRFRDSTFVDGKSPYSDCPIGAISLAQAMAYCRWLSEAEGIPPEEMCYPPIDEIESADFTVAQDVQERSGYRLPTIDEWEYVCRAGATTRYYFGSSKLDLSKYEWFERNSKFRTHSVGVLKPNDFGLFDMLGNVMEWVHGTPSSDSMLCGGNYQSSWHVSHCSRALSVSPGYRDPGVGFRVVRTLKERDTGDAQSSNDLASRLVGMVSNR